MILAVILVTRREQPIVKIPAHKKPLK